MISVFGSLLSWLPAGLEVLALGAIVIFFLVTLFRLWAFIMDLIPFL